MGFSGTPHGKGTPFPYYSHTTPIRIPEDMGIVWEAYHKGVQLLGVGITLDIWQVFVMIFYHGKLGGETSNMVYCQPGSLGFHDPI